MDYLASSAVSSLNVNNSINIAVQQLSAEYIDDLDKAISKATDYLSSTDVFNKDTIISLVALLTAEVSKLSGTKDIFDNTLYQFSEQEYETDKVKVISYTRTRIADREHLANRIIDVLCCLASQFTNQYCAKNRVLNETV